MPARSANLVKGMTPSPAVELSPAYASVTDFDCCHLTRRLACEFSDHIWCAFQAPRTLVTDDVGWNFPTRLLRLKRFSFRARVPVKPCCYKELAMSHPKGIFSAASAECSSADARSFLRICRNWQLQAQKARQTGGAGTQATAYLAYNLP